MNLAWEGEEWESLWTIFVSNFSSEKWIKAYLPPETEKSPGWSSASNLTQKVKIPYNWQLMKSFFLAAVVPSYLIFISLKHVFYFSGV